MSETLLFFWLFKILFHHSHIFISFKINSLSPEKNLISDATPSPSLFLLFLSVFRRLSSNFSMVNNWSVSIMGWMNEWHTDKKEEDEMSSDVRICTHDHRPFLFLSSFWHWKQSETTWSSIWSSEVLNYWLISSSLFRPWSPLETGQPQLHE